MTTNRIVQQIDITGGVTRKFTSSLGRANSELSKISDSLAEQRREQAKLQAQIDKGDANEDQLRSYRRQMEQLTKEIDDQEEAYQRLNKAQNARNRRLAIGGALVGAGIAGGALLVGTINKQTEAAKEFLRIQADTGVAAQDVGALATQARDYFPGLDPTEIGERFAQAQRELELRLQEDGPETDFLRGVVGDADKLHDQFIAILDHAFASGNAADVFERAFGGTEGEFLAGLARQGNLDELTESLRNLDPALQAEYSSIIEVALATRDMNNAIGDLQRTLVANLGPAITKIVTTLSNWTTKVSIFIQNNQTLAKIIGVVLVGAIAALIIVGGLLLLTVIVPMIASGFAMIVAWAPVILVLIGVGLVIAGIVALLGSLGIIDFDTSKVTEGFKAVQASIDPKIIARATVEDEQARNRQGDTIINQTNNIEATGDAEQIAQTVGDETSNAIHRSVHIQR